MAEILPCVLIGRASLGNIFPKIIFKRKLLRRPGTRREMAMHSSRRKFHTHDPLKIASGLQEVECSQNRREHENLHARRHDVD